VGWCSGSGSLTFVFGCCRTSTVNVFNALVFHVLICRLVNPIRELLGGAHWRIGFCLSRHRVVCLELIRGNLERELGHLGWGKWSAAYELDL